MISEIRINFMNSAKRKIHDLIQSTSDYYDEIVDKDLSKDLLEKLNLENEIEIYSSRITNFLSSCNRGDLKETLTALESICILLSTQKDTFHELFLQSESLPIIIEFLKKEYENCEILQIESTKIILLISNSEEGLKMFEKNTVCFLISNNILAESEKLREISLQTLFTLAEKSENIKYELIVAKLSKFLREMFSNLSLNPSLISNSVRLMRSLLKKIEEPSSEFKIEQNSLLDILLDLLNSEDITVLIEIFITLSKILEDECYREKSTNQDLFRKILILSDYDHDDLKQNLLLTIKNVIAWGEEYCDFFLENNLISILRTGIKNTNYLIRKTCIEILFTLMNNKKNNDQLIGEIQNAGITLDLISMLKYDSDDIPVMSFTVMTKLCEVGKFKDIKFLIDKGYLEIISSILKNPKDIYIRGLCEKSLESIIYKTKEAFGAEKHPMILLCYNKVQAIVRSIYGSNQKILQNEIGKISMESQKNNFDSSV